MFVPHGGYTASVKESTPLDIARQGPVVRQLTVTISGGADTLTLERLGSSLRELAGVVDVTVDSDNNVTVQYDVSLALCRKAG